VSHEAESSISDSAADAESIRGDKVLDTGDTRRMDLFEETIVGAGRTGANCGHCECNQAE
jgi:hypothetical protein